MNDQDISRVPPVLEAIRADSERIGFTLASDPRAGSLLRALAATKPGGRLLELGTGTGVGTAWLLDGMDRNARLISVDNDPRASGIAQRHIGTDSRVSFHVEDGAAFLEGSTGTFDLIFADAWPGKFTHLDRALSLLRPGGIYFVDDLLPQPNWPEGHGSKVQALVADLGNRRGFVTVMLAWSSGLMALVRTHDV